MVGRHKEDYCQPTNAAERHQLTDNERNNPPRLHGLPPFEGNHAIKLSWRLGLPIKGVSGAENFSHYYIPAHYVILAIVEALHRKWRLVIEML